MSSSISLFAGRPTAPSGSPWAGASGKLTRNYSRRATRSTSSRTGSNLRDARRLPGEQLRVVPKRLELERVARRIEEEHRRLLADFAFEAHVRLDDELRAGERQALREAFPLQHRQHHAEMPDRHGIAVHRARGHGTALIGREVRDDLVAVQVEVHPFVAAASLRTLEQVAIEAARLGEVAHGEGEVERTIDGAHAAMIIQAVRARIALISPAASLCGSTADQVGLPCSRFTSAGPWPAPSSKPSHEPGFRNRGASRSSLLSTEMP